MILKSVIKIKSCFKIINLTSTFHPADCQVVRLEKNKAKYRCTGNRTFRSARERWWFIAASNCESKKVLNSYQSTDHCLIQLQSPNHHYRDCLWSIVSGWQMAMRATFGTTTFQPTNFVILHHYTYIITCLIEHLIADILPIMICFGILQLGICAGAILFGSNEHQQ